MIGGAPAFVTALPPVLAEQKDGATTLPISARGMVLERITEPFLEEPSPADFTKPKVNSRRCPSFAAGGSVSNFCMETGLGPLVIQSCSLGMLTFLGIAYNYTYLYRILPAAGKGHFVIPFFCLFNLVYAMALWSYFRAHCSNPGLVPERWKQFVEHVGVALSIAPARLEWQPGKATYCKKCRIARPERAHHCNVCNICVLRMDHHCPWINNCVGYLNHKFFLLLVGYALAACLLAFVTSLPELLSYTGALAKLQKSDIWQRPHLSISDVLTFLVFGWLCLAFLVILGPMLAQHVHLASINATTIEAHYDNMPNPFDLGTPMRNLEQILGAFGPDWFLPVMPARPLSDGVTFSRNFETLGPDGLPQGIVREGQPWVMQENLWRVRYQVRPAPPMLDQPPDSGFQELMGLTGCLPGCYAPCSLSRDIDTPVMMPHSRVGWGG